MIAYPMKTSIISRLLLSLTLMVSMLLVSLPADAQSRTGKGRAKTTKVRQNQLKTPASPSPVGDTDRTIKDLLYFPFSCLNCTVSSVEQIRQEIIDTFGTCETINMMPGLHYSNDAFDFTYRSVPIGVCYYDWYNNRCWYNFYFNTKAEANRFKTTLINDIQRAGIPLTKDNIYGGMSNRKKPVSIFKWVYVNDPEIVKEDNGSNIVTPDVVGMYMIELGIYKQ